jgi:hypothetical protein
METARRDYREAFLPGYVALGIAVVAPCHEAAIPFQSEPVRAPRGDRHKIVPPRYRTLVLISAAPGDEGSIGPQGDIMQTPTATATKPAVGVALPVVLPQVTSDPSAWSPEYGRTAMSDGAGAALAWSFQPGHQRPSARLGVPTSRDRPEPPSRGPCTVRGVAQRQGTDRTAARGGRGQPRRREPALAPCIAFVLSPISQLSIRRKSGPWYQRRNGHILVARHQMAPPAGGIAPTDERAGLGSANCRRHEDEQAEQDEGSPGRYAPPAHCRCTYHCFSQSRKSLPAPGLQ